MVKIIVENNPDLERASLAQQLAQHLEQTTPLTRLNTFYKKHGLELISDANTLIDSKKSGFERGVSLMSLIWEPILYVFGQTHIIKEERVYVTKACRTFCGNENIGFGVELLGDEYAGMVRESLEKFCEAKHIDTAKLVRYSEPKGIEYPARRTGIAG